MEKLPNLLIVDDYEDNLILLERILEKQNLNPIKAFSGAVDYMSKPINIHILLSKISVFLNLSTQKQTVILHTETLGKISEDLRSANDSLKKSEERLKDIIFNMADWMREVDENADMPMNLQTKILRATEEKVITRVGDTS